AGDTPGDGVAALSVTDVNGTPVNGFVDITGTYGDLLVNSAGDYLFVANASVDPLQVGDNPTESFNFTVSDGNGHDVPTTVTFNVIGADAAPIITSAVASGSLTEDAGPTIAVNGGFETGDLTGWLASDVSVNFVGAGGDLGNYTAQLNGSGSLEQD